MGWARLTYFYLRRIANCQRSIRRINQNCPYSGCAFPTLIAISTIFFGGIAVANLSSVFASLSVVVMILIGIAVTLLVSKFLSRTVLKGIPSSFTLELPPYRKPQIGKILVRSLLDRTIFVLGRAIVVAAPAGAVTWIFANIMIGDVSVLNHCAAFLEPFGKLLGLDGFIIMAFLLGLPANEIVLPILIMSYMSQGAMLELDNLQALKNLLIENNWTWITGLNFMLFSLLHFPCATTLLTIRKETNGMKWTLFTLGLTTGIAVLVTFTINMLANLLGLV
ncbi:nucleoside recognition domain-containing protein [Brassicibacter mesophilus]|uniref:nucleoside recognition domain-containing protein n=1 Tax=Brassicibacter mesophilus TaxID=745119 RepID=UPI003D19F017